MAASTVNVLSLCSGVAGGDLSVRFAVRGTRTICYVEREIACAAILATRMRQGLLDDAPIWSCVETFDGKAWRGLVHIVVAGIPCQGNSLAGKRELENDPRNLWAATRRILREVGPEYFFLENVFGFLVPERDRGLAAPIARILGELGEDGYDAEWLTIPASATGTSHQRDRVFVLAHSKRAESWRGNGGEQSNGRRRRGFADDYRALGDSECAERRTNAHARIDECNREKAGRQQRTSRLAISGESVGDAIGTNGLQRQPIAGEGRKDRSGEGSAEDTARRSEPMGNPGSREPGRLSGGPSGERLSTNGSTSGAMGLFPPGPGLGLDKVVEDVLELLDADPDRGYQKFLAELAQWAAWQRILAEHPEVAPATAQPGIHRMADEPAIGLGDGWASRSEQLRALGNGLHVACGAVAFVILLDRIQEAADA